MTGVAGDAVVEKFCQPTNQKMKKSVIFKTVIDVDITYSRHLNAGQ